MSVCVCVMHMAVITLYVCVFLYVAHGSESPYMSVCLCLFSLRQMVPVCLECV